MVNDGQLSLCEPCYPQTLVKYHIENGELKHTETTVYGPNEPYMYLYTDNQLLGMTKAELMEIYQQLKMQLPSDLSEDNLKSRPKECKRTPTFGIWHDHSEILGRGYILVSVKDFYECINRMWTLISSTKCKLSLKSLKLIF